VILKIAKSRINGDVRDKLLLTAIQYGEVCYPTTAPGRVQVIWPENCPGARRVWRTFCLPGTMFVEHYECRSTNCLGARNLSRCRIL